MPFFFFFCLIASQDAFRQKTSEVSANDFKIREAKLAIGRDSNSIADDQPLSMWIEGIHSSSIEESSKLTSLDLCNYVFWYI